jgi:hypothetical protein
LEVIVLVVDVEVYSTASCVSAAVVRSLVTSRIAMKRLIGCVVAEIAASTV